MIKKKKWQIDLIMEIDHMLMDVQMALILERCSQQKHIVLVTLLTQAKCKTPIIVLREVQ